jgi:hypothetical protein
LPARLDGGHSSYSFGPTRDIGRPTVSATGKRRTVAITRGF